MIDLEYLKNNIEEYKKNLKDRQLKVEDFKLEEITKLYEEKKELTRQVQEIERQRNLLTGRRQKQVDEKAKKLRSELQELESKLREAGSVLETLSMNLPNIASPEVPVGKNEKDNIVMREVGEKRKFDFEPKDYLALAGWLVDMERGANVAGRRFAYLFGDLVLLEFALAKLAFDVLLPKGFIPVLPPVMIKPEVFSGMGRLGKGQEGERYFMPKDNLYLVGSAEHTIGPIHMNEILREDELPKRYLGFSTCFRREAGSYGKDTKGILRVHQFDKVEMFSFTTPEKSEEEHQFLLACQEELIHKLELPYRVIQICTGDLGFTDWKQYDIETWMPGEGTYRETHSCSNTTDFQARGVNIKYRVQASSLKSQVRYVHILNATAFAIGRILIAIIENYQQKDGSIVIPKVLQSYVGKDRITNSAN